MAIDGSPRNVDVDVGRVGKRHFLNVAHIGLGSEISRSVDSSDKHWWGRFSYLRKLFDSFRQRRGFRAHLRCDGETLRGRWLSIAIANGRSFGGGHRIVGATPFDGMIDVIAVRPRSIWQLMLNWLRFRVLLGQPAPQVVITL